MDLVTYGTFASECHLGVSQSGYYFHVWYRHACSWKVEEEGVVVVEVVGSFRKIVKQKYKQSHIISKMHLKYIKSKHSHSAVKKRVPVSDIWCKTSLVC